MNFRPRQPLRPLPLRHTGALAAICLALCLGSTSAAGADCSSAEAECLAVADVQALPGSARVEVPVIGRAQMPVVGYSFAVGHDPLAARLVEIRAGAAVLAHGAEMVLSRIDNTAEIPFGTILVVLDAEAPLGDVPSIDLSGGLRLATFVYEILPGGSPGDTVELRLGHRVFGQPPVASVLINEDLDSLVPDLCNGTIRLVGGAPFLRGDCEGDGRFDITDVIFELLLLFKGGAGSACPDSCDTNDDGEVNVSDPIHSLLFLFAGGPPPAAPYPLAGVDPTADTLECNFTLW